MGSRKEYKIIDKLNMYIFYLCPKCSICLVLPRRLFPVNYKLFHKKQLTYILRGLVSTSVLKAFFLQRQLLSQEELKIELKFPYLIILSHKSYIRDIMPKKMYALHNIAIVYMKQKLQKMQGDMD